MPRSVALLGSLLVPLVGCSEDLGPATSGGATDGEASAIERPRNVLLFVVDTLRADRLGPYGYELPTSPNLDALAERGTVYVDNRSQAPWTAPSMISMMTGLYVTDEEQLLPPNRPVIAEWMQDAGFTTVGLVGNGVLSADRGFDRGFDHFEHATIDNGSVIAETFVEWLDSSAPDPAAERGFFAWLHLLDPHTPFQARAGYDALPDRRVGQEELERRWRREQERVAELSPDLDGWPYERARYAMVDASRRYDSEVQAADHALGQVLDALEERGLLEETLVVFASDHGEIIYEYPHYPLEVDLRLEREGGLAEGVMGLMALGHRAWFYPELWNTPLVFAGPGFPAGERVEGLSGNIDILPTLLGLCDVDYDEGPVGLDLTGGRSPERERLFAHGWETSTLIEREGIQFIEHNRQRFLWPGKDGPRPVELFDHTLGELELTDRSDERPDEVDRLQATLEDWRAEHARDDTLTKPSAESYEVLRRMGYVEEGMIDPDAAPGPADGDGADGGGADGDGTR